MEGREGREARTGMEGVNGGQGGERSEDGDGRREWRAGMERRMKSDRKVDRKVHEVERVSTCRMPRHPSWELCWWRLDVDQMLRRLHGWQRRAACEHNKVIRT